MAVDADSLPALSLRSSSPTDPRGLSSKHRETRTTELMSQCNVHASFLDWAPLRTKSFWRSSSYSRSSFGPSSRRRVLTATTMHIHLQYTLSGDNKKSTLASSTKTSSSSSSFLDPDASHKASMSSCSS